jgi:iron(III) transport system ATP-binding protein
LTLEQVSHAYGAVEAVRDVSLTLAPGELVCLLGPSGCGKTTVLRVTAGLEELQKGRVLIDGRVVADGRLQEAPESRNVGLMFQDYALFPHLSAADNVEFGLRRLTSADRRARAAEALEQVGMGGQAKAFPHTLSGGQQQRVALARALAPEPYIMLLDEPFSGLDVRLRNQIRDDALHVLKSSGAATLMVTHDPEEAMFMADRIAVMRDGRLLQVGPPADLYYAPSNAFVAGFFGDINRLQARVANGRVATVLGEVEASGFADGLEVEVLIRPEALTLRPAATGGSGGDADGEGGGRARVMAARLLGRTSLVHLSVDGADGQDLHLHARVPGRFLPEENEIMSVQLDGQDLHLHARVPGRFLPEENEIMSVQLDRSQTFVFAASEAK